MKIFSLISNCINTKLIGIDDVMLIKMLNLLKIIVRNVVVRSSRQIVQ